MYSDSLANRVRHILKAQRLTEKKMFGGLAFFLNGNLCVGIMANDLIARVGSQNHQESLESAHTAVFAPTGKPMTGWILVSADGVETDSALAEWIDRALEFVRTLPPK